MLLGKKDKEHCVIHNVNEKADTGKIFQSCCERNDFRPDLLFLEIEEKTYLVMSCFRCGINLFDINVKDQKPKNAFHELKVRAICEGKDNTLYASVTEREWWQCSVAELDCSTTEFKQKRILFYDNDPSGIERDRIKRGGIERICYIPDQHRLIVSVSTLQDGAHFLAISCENREKLWSLPGKKCMFLRYHPEQNGMILCASKSEAKCELEVICPETGSRSQMILVPDVRDVIGIALSEGRIFVQVGHG